MTQKAWGGSIQVICKRHPILCKWLASGIHIDPQANPFQDDHVEEVMWDSLLHFIRASFAQSFSHCICLYVRVYEVDTCVCVHFPVETRGWQSCIILSCPPYILRPSLQLKLELANTVSLAGQWALGCSLLLLTAPCCCYSPKRALPCLAFDMNAGNSNTGLHDCAASTLSTEPSL